MFDNYFFVQLGSNRQLGELVSFDKRYQLSKIKLFLIQGFP